MSEFKTSDGRDVLLMEVDVRGKKSAMVLLSGEGLPTLVGIGSYELEPDRWLTIHNRGGASYDTVTRVHLGMVPLTPVRAKGEMTNVMGGGVPGTGTGPAAEPGQILEKTFGEPGDTSVWLVSSHKARYACVLPFGVDAVQAAEMVSEAVEGPFVVESLYAGTVRAGPDLTVPGWSLFTEEVLAPARAFAP
jgi:hypothetical protein